MLPRSNTSRRGFTLVEVLVALAILAIALLGFNQGQSSSARMVLRSEKRFQAYELAQEVMTEAEIEMKKKNFEALKDEEKVDFKDERFKEFKAVKKYEKVDLGCFMPSDKPKEGEQQDNQAMGFFDMAQKIFEQSIRKVVVTVEWSEGNKKQKISLAQLYVRFDDMPSFQLK